MTDGCLGRCRHCSQGSHPVKGHRLDPRLAADAVLKVTEVYEIETVMAFGGEPLLHPEGVMAVMEAAQKAGVPHRQVITGGYFSKNTEKMREVVEALARCGVNDLRLSVDAFHQEHIPLEVVKDFALLAKEAGLPLSLQPAWLLGRDRDNCYNRQTKALLEEFSSMGIGESEGNVIFPEGNAAEFLAEYFEKETAPNPYEEDPTDLRCLSFSADGSVLSGNVYLRDVMELIKDYRPQGVTR